MNGMRCWVSACVMLASLFAGAVSAQTLHSVFIDTDNDAATGCSVVTPAGTVSGVETRLQATVDGTPPSIVSLTRAQCAGSDFGAVATLPAGIPLGLDNGDAGADVIEFATSLDGLGNGGPVRLVVVSAVDGGADLLTATGIVLPGGGVGPGSEPPAIIPAGGVLGLLLLIGAMLWLVRRHPGLGASMAVLLLIGSGAGVAWAASFIADGDVGDWIGVAPLASDPVGDPTNADARIDLVSVYAATEAGRFFVRLDVRDAAAADNTAPVLEDATFDVLANAPNGTLIGAVSASDADAGQTLAYAITAGNTLGAFAIDAATGAITVADSAAVAAANAPFVLTVTVTDNGTPAASDTAVVTITVTAVNTAPTFVLAGNPPPVNEDAGPQNIAAFATQIDDNDGGTQTPYVFDIVSNSNAALFAAGPAIAADGTLTYTPAADANGIATVTVQLRDAGGNANGGDDTSATASFTITVAAVNDAPSFAPGADVAVAEDAPAYSAPWASAITAGPSDEISQALAFSTTVVTGADLFAAAPQVLADGTLQFTPAPDATGVATVEVILKDNGGTANGGGDASTAHTLTITIDGDDDAPVAVDDAATVDEDAAATPIDVLANDTDTDAGPRAIASVTQPLNGSVAIIDGGATLTYQPNADYCGADTFAYTLAPGGSSATVVVDVACIDDAPIAVDDAATVVEDAGATTIDVLANDTDIDAGPRSLASITQPANGIAGIVGDVVSYTPTPDVCGADSFTYALAPGATSATVAIAVTCVDDAPVAVDDAAVIAEDAPATPIDVLANDTDVDAGPRAIAAVTQPGKGIATITGGGSGLTYAPNGIDCGADSFTYTLAPGGSTATVAVTLPCDDDAPVAVDDNATLDEDAVAVVIAVLANDTDIDGGPMAIASVTQPANGVAAILGDTVTYAPAADVCGSDAFSYTLAPGGSTATVTVTVNCVDDAPVAVNDIATVAEDAPATLIDVLANDTDVDAGPRSVASVTQAANGVVANAGGTGATYTPNANFCGSDSFSYTLAPGSSTATVSISVTCVDDAPVAVADAATVTEDAPVTPIDVLGNDTDVDAGPRSVASVTQAANGVVANAGGTGATYTPNANFCGSDSFTYTLAPGSSTATVSITVACVDDAPVAVADAATVAEDAIATPIDVLANDTDIDGGPWSIASVTPPANGVAAVTGGGTGLTYAPVADFCGSDSFVYTLTPGGSTATVSVAVTCVDDAPVAVADLATVPQNAAATGLDVLANDTDIDGGPIAVASVTQPANGTAAIAVAGTGVTYAPNAAYCGVDTFTYTLTPGGNTAGVTVTVPCPDAAPVAVDDTDTTVQNAGPLAIDVLANDTDADGGPISIASVTQPSSGSVAITGGGTGLSFQPAPTSCGPVEFTYTLAPGGSTATVTVDVTAFISGNVLQITSSGGCDASTILYLLPETPPLPPVVDVNVVNPEASTLQFTLAGPDADDFSIDAAGVLTFDIVPEPFVTYVVEVTVGNGFAFDVQTLTVVVGAPYVQARYVLALVPGESTNLDVRVFDFFGVQEPSAPFTINGGNSAVAAVSPTGEVIAGASSGITSVLITSPGHRSWTSSIHVGPITTITAPLSSPQSISNTDPFSAFGSNSGQPSTSYYGDLYRIALTAGQTIEITMDSGDDLDTYLLLANDQGFLVAGNDDDDQNVLGVGSRIIYTATQTGVYTIEASTFNGLDTGAYVFGVSVTP